MLRRPNWLWAIVVLLGWSFDFFFWKAEGVGINFAAYLLICLLGGFVFLIVNGLRPAPKSLWLLVPFLFFAIITFVRREPLALFLAYVYVFVSLGLLTFTYLGGKWPQYSLLDYFKKFLQLDRTLIAQPFILFREAEKERTEFLENAKGLPIKPVLRGFLIALPIVIILTALLSSADAVFNQKLLDIFGRFDLPSIPEAFVRFVIIVLVAYVLTGVFLHAALYSKDERLLGEERPLFRPSLGFTEAAIVLGSVVSLFLTFVFIQFQYFFGGEVNIGVDGYTYSEYARSGFNELITVAMISLSIVLGLSTLTIRKNNPQRLAYSGLSAALLAEVIVILVSAYQRLTLAIDWHGFSRLRLYPRVFLIWVGILFAVVIVLEVLHRERYFGLAALLAACGFAATLGIFNVDGTIVSYNVFRAVQGKHFNVYHLTTLSSDAVPALADAFNNPSLPAEIHQGIGAAIVCYTYSDDFYTDVRLYRPVMDWRSFTFSRWMAMKALREVKEHFGDYRVDQDERGDAVKIYTPDNVIYECGNR